MKHKLSISAVVLMMTCFATQLHAQDFIAGNLGYYYHDNNTVSVSAVYDDNNNSITSGNVTIPNTVSHDGISYTITRIDAFWGSTGITSVTIPNTVTYISDDAFYGCSGLLSVTMSNSLVHIGDFAFYGCSNLASVTIPQTVRYLGSSAFENCTGMLSVTFNADSCGFAGTAPGTPWIYDNEIHVNPAFYGCNNIAYFIIGDHVKIIPDYLCYNLLSLASVTIPDSVEMIGQYAFYNCSGMNSIVYNAKECYCNDYFNARSPFNNCSGVTNVTFGSNVKSIPHYLCSDFIGLTSVTIPPSVTSIGDAAFSNCSGLSSVVFNADSCTYAGVYVEGDNDEHHWYNAFYNCNNVISFIIGSNVKVIPMHLCYGLTGLTTVSIPPSVRVIGDGAFEGCVGLTEVTFSNTLRRIEDDAFRYCSNLTSAELPDSLLYLGFAAFEECGFTSVTIPPNVDTIWGGVFTGCPLTVVNYNATNAHTEEGHRGRSFNPHHTTVDSQTLNIGSNVRTIPDDIFNGMKITSVDLPDSLLTIGESAFGNTKLVSVTIPNMVTTIGREAFQNMEGTLRRVTIGESVSSIDAYAFRSNGALDSVYALPTVPPTITGNTFSGTALKIIVPCGSKEVYKQAPGWRNFPNIKEDPSCPPEEINDIDAINISIYQHAGKIVVEGDFIGDVLLFDIIGQQIEGKRHFENGATDLIVPASGVYLVKIGNHPARKIVVVK